MNSESRNDHGPVSWDHIDHTEQQRKCQSQGTLLLLRSRDIWDARMPISNRKGINMNHQILKWPYWIWQLQQYTADAFVVFAAYRDAQLSGKVPGIIEVYFVILNLEWLGVPRVNANSIVLVCTLLGMPKTWSTIVRKRICKWCCYLCPFFGVDNVHTYPFQRWNLKTRFHEGLPFKM